MPITIKLHNQGSTADAFTKAETKVTTAFCRVINYLAEANDSTLSFNKLSTKNRDDLCNRSYAFQADPKLDTLGIRPRKNAPHVIGYNKTIENMHEFAVAKLICHEIDHTLYSPTTHTGLIACRVISSASQTLLPLWGAGLVLENEGAFAAVGCASLGYLVSQYIVPLANWPLRLAELHADDFSDRMIPEISKRDLFEEHMIASERKEALGQMISNEMNIQRIDALFREHPSYYTRYKLSEKNCPIYLRQKQQLGIPSLILQ